MYFELSNFGKKFSNKSGILELMEDLADVASTNEKMIMMGCGNPAGIPEMQKIWQKLVKDLLKDKNKFNRMVEKYDGHCGRIEFLEMLANFFNKLYGWNITSKNIGINKRKSECILYAF